MARVDFEPRLEFAAPHYKDFDAVSSDSRASRWFEEQKEDNSAKMALTAEACGDEAQSSGRTPLRDVGNEAVPIKPAQADAEVVKPARKNIVTSWSPRGVSKKRSAEEGASEQPVAKAAKHCGGDDPKPEPKEPKTKPKPKPKRAKAAKENALKVVNTQIVKPKKEPVMLAKLTKILHKRNAALVARSTKQLTIPEELELHTSKRAHAHKHANGEQVEQHDEDQSGPAPTPYKPLVQRVKEFDKTPGRFKRVPDDPLPNKVPEQPTVPMEPKLRVSRRGRASMFKPRDVEEEEMMAHMPVFRASTLNPLILSGSGALGVPKVEKRGPTEPQPFNFVTDNRADRRAALQQQQSDGDGAQKEVPMKARKSVACFPGELVVPRSPRLHTKLRARESKVEETKREFRALPLPKSGSMPSMELKSLNLHSDSAPRPTHPEPFRLATEQRGEQHRSTMVARLAAEEEEARRARVPRAHALPLSTEVPMVPPKPTSRKSTIPMPFSLASDVRHEQFQELRRKALEEEEEAKRREAAFKAQPMWKGMPFRVHDAGYPLTVPEDVPLVTSSRAVARGAFNKIIEGKMKETEEAAKKAAEEERQREEEERQRLRKAAAFHARPMPDLSVPPPVKPPSAKPLTTPVSPRLGKSKRRAAK